MPESVAAERNSARYCRLALAVACVWFARGYCTIRAPYIDLQRYALGLERMPFQGRDLMRWPMLAAAHAPWLQHATAERAVLRSPEFLVMEIAAAIALFLATRAAERLYRLALPEGPLPLLPSALLIVVCLFDFVLDVPFSFPYDLPATAFLGWGIVFIAERRFRALLPVFLLGTWNRETTLFLVGVLLLTAAMGSSGPALAGPRLTLGGRPLARGGRSLALGNLRRKDWMQAGVLLVCWGIITGWQHHHYARNLSEAGSRIGGNVHQMLNPTLWPNILSVSAFLLPYVYLNRAKVSHPALHASLLLLPFWLLLLLSVGQVLEARIYGDISVFVAVAAALIIVQQIQRVPGTRPLRSVLAE